MNSFSANWLDLREPIDHAARNEEITSALCHYFLNDEKLTIADIGGGTGSTLRALQPIMPQSIHWHILDNDTDLIEVAKRKSSTDSTSYTYSDLANSIAPVFDPIPNLITTSAFLDLVSMTWLEILVSEITSRKLPFYSALSYDGRINCAPAHPADTSIIHAFNLHQKTDKGFGAALGPDAASVTGNLFRNAGYTVFEGPSDWNAGATHAAFQRQLLEGWCNATCEISPDKKSIFIDWHAARMTDIDSGKLNVTVGHQDLLAVPPEV